MRFVFSLAPLVLLLAAAQHCHAKSINIDEEKDMTLGLQHVHTATFNAHVSNVEGGQGLHASRSFENRILNELHGSNINSGTRIGGGIPTDKTRYHYFTALFYPHYYGGELNKNSFYCGGSLIRKDVIVTAGKWCHESCC
jgi:hypothetical protein